MKKTLLQCVEQTIVPEDEYLDQDQEILTFFVEELEDILLQLDELLQQWQARPEQVALWAELRRRFHTIKGSGRLVGAHASAELAWTVEEIFNQLQMGKIQYSDALQHYVLSVTQLFKKQLLADLSAQQAHRIELRPAILLGQCFVRHQQQREAWMPELFEILEQQLLGQYQAEDISAVTHHVPAHANHNENGENAGSIAISSTPVAGTPPAQPNFWSYSSQFPPDVIDLSALMNDPVPAVEPVQAQHDQPAQAAKAHKELAQPSIFSEQLSEQQQSVPSAEPELPAQSEPTTEDESSPVTEATLSAALLEADDAETVMQIFLQEAAGQLDLIESFIQLEQPTEQQQNDLIRTIHTLRGGAAIAKLDRIAQASQQVEQWLSQHAQMALQTESGLLSHYLEYVRDYLYVSQQQPNELQLQTIQQGFDNAWERYQLQASYQEQGDHRDLIRQLLALEIDDVLNTEAEFASRIQNDFTHYLQLLKQQLEKLSDLCGHASVQGIYQYSRVLIFNYDLLLGTPQLIEHERVSSLLAQMHQQLISLFDALATGQYALLSAHANQIGEELTTYLIEHQQTDQTDYVQGDGEAFQLQVEVADEIPAFELEEQDGSGLNACAEQLPLLTDEALLAGDSLIEQKVALPLLEDDTQFEPVDSGIESNQAAIESGGALPVTDDQAHASDLAHLGWTQRLQQAIQADQYLQHSDRARRDLDPDVLEFFVEEAQELLESIQQDYQIWLENLELDQAMQQIMRHLHTFKGGANMLPAPYLAELTHELESIYQRIQRKQMPALPEVLQCIELLQQDLSQRIQIISQLPLDFPADQTLAVVTQLLEAPLDDVTPDTDQPEPGLELEDAAIESVPAPVPVMDEPDEHLATVPESGRSELEAIVLQTEATEEAEPEVEKTPEQISQESFVQEANELLVQANSMLSQWFEQRGNRSLLLQLQRIAHSLKGGARMVQQPQVADIAYILETTFEQFAIQNFNSNAYDGLLSYALVWLRKAILQQQFEHFASLKAGLDHIEYVETSAQLPEKIAKANQQLTAFSFNASNGDGVEPPSMLGEWVQPVHQEEKDDVLRVSADLIEKLLDLSGENAINRAHVEMDLSQLEISLNEMEMVIRRMADQLRRMEGELEAQIITQHGDAGKRYHDFDLLEMDEYSALNQLSKALAESASDLLDYKSTIISKVKDTESVLLRQSRIQSELQQGLMQARLVPLNHMLPRLQKLVRQVSESLDKPTELQVQHAEGEVDRTILDRLVSPIEHMLRNALDHGIELPEQRMELGKPEQGQLSLSISHEGAELVVTVQDDGRGLDVAKIRQKAEQLGLIQAGLPYSDQEILQFIFHPGFSTAEKLTQISGRGVGLDIVQSEIKAIGGQISINSALGQGTTFRIRVPTSVAVSDALMVQVAGQQYAVPLTQIEQVIRVPVTQLAQYFACDTDNLVYQGSHYRLRYLAEFLGGSAQPHFNTSQPTMAVLVLKNKSEQHPAVLVDKLVGSRSQIVMKSVGAQFAQVDIIAGATILGDGQVCLILDGQSIVSQVQSSQRIYHSAVVSDQALETSATPLIMVVDDSVTVRKVTSRLLERHGYQVVTANDGIDATTQLEHLRPDVMLLDIEMPRMDGFEVTHWVRHHEQLNNLPIIMITSRVGEKHRERAISLGVTHYMGKPFQEDQLMQTLQHILQQEQPQGASHVPD